LLLQSRKEERGERGESGKRRKQTAPHHGPSVTRAKRALLYC
jgi:hypothetical protein